MNIPFTLRYFARALLAIPLAFGLLAAASNSFAATDDQIEGAIIQGIEWLVDNQAADGSWGGYYGTPTTCFALIKLQDRAFELGFDSPFDADYDYVDYVIYGWKYVLSSYRTQVQTIGLTPAGNNPDGNGNGLGVFFNYDDFHVIYPTGICLMALASTGNPDRPNDAGLDLLPPAGPDTYGQLAEDTAEYLAWAQTDYAPGRGGWYYNATYDIDRSDNSHAGYATLGLAAAQNFGVSIPAWVKSELSIWIDYIQNDVSGGSGYYHPDNWVNVLKTGNLLFEMIFVGDTCDTPRFQAALAYIQTHWYDTGNGHYSTGWGYSTSPAHYQAMYTTMKGLEYAGLDLINLGGFDKDWFNQEPPLTPPEDLASVLVAQQRADGSWYNPYAWDYTGGTLSTLWALLTIEKIAPESDPFEVTVTKDYRYTAVCFERDNDFDALFNEDPVNFETVIDPATGEEIQVPIDDDQDGLFNEDDVDCDPSDIGYELPLTGLDPEAYTVEAVLKKNGNVSSYNPGQYYAVSAVELCRHNERYESVFLTIEENFEQCTVSDYPLSVLNPRTGGGSVVVVEVDLDTGVAYQIYDAMSGVVTIDYDGDLEKKATAEFQYDFAPGQEHALLLVYVKFGPGLKGLPFAEVVDPMCQNFNAATLEVFEDPEPDPTFITFDEASAWLKVIEK